ncbi:hypothetical protein KC799_18790, partial [candidate division KSB1 bacterium]|nr:hypothetical protein [candidate division KSB1 bacterium]
MFAYKKIFVLLLFAFLASCVTTYDVIEQGETLILTDQTRIPCRILDFDGVDVYFKARRGADAYRYGEFITIGNLEAIHVTKGGQTLSYSPLEYLDEKFPVENVETPGAENAPSEEEYPQAAPEDSTAEETVQPELTINTE